MAIIDFPSSPSVNDTYSFGNKTWVFNGQGWQLVSTSAINGIVIGNANAASGNFTTVGATGNITSDQYFIGNGAFLTGIAAGYSNANVAAYLPNYQGLISNVDFRSTSPAAVALVVTDRPLTMGGNSLSYITLPDDGNANSVAAELTNHGLGNVLISAGPADYEWIFDHTGNLTLPGSSFAVNYANGQQISLSGTYSNVNVKAYLESGTTINANFGGGTLKTTGIANLGPTTVNGNLTVAGNISATGNLTYINVQDLVIDDPLIYLGASNPSDVEDLGIVAAFTDGVYQHTGFARDYTDKTWKVFTGVTSEPNTVVAWDQAVMAPFKAGSILSNATITANANVTAVGNVSGSYLLGNGYFITGLPAGYSNSDVANYLASNAAVTILITGNITTAANIVAGNITTTGSANIAGNLTAGNLLGTGSNTTVAAGSYSWVFDNAGNLTLAGNTFAVNYANGTQISLGTSYSNSNAAAYLASNAAVTILTTSNITTAANITGNYILGNGSLLTGIITSVSNINNGTSNIRIDSSGGNILANVGGTANVVIISNAGINVAGYVSATGNVSGGNITTTGMVSATGNITSSGNISAGNITATGNLTAGNLLGSGSNTTVAAGSYNWVFDDTGNLTLSGNTFAVNYANGQQISLGGTYSNSTVANYLASNAAVTILTTGNITSAANVTANYLLGNGYFISGIQYSNIAGSYSNANVANYLPTYTGNVGAGNFVGSGDNVTISAGVYTWTFNNLGNLSAPGNLTATGNITGNYILGNGSLLTGIITSVSNINNGNSNIRIDTSGGNILANVGGTANAVIISNAGINVAGYVTAVGNITTSANVTANNVITTGNVTSGNFVGSGANVNIGAGVYTWNFNDTGNLVLPANTFAVNYANGTPVTFPGTYSNANVAAYLPTYNGNALFGNVTVSQDAVVLGNLRVEGNTTYINVTDLIIEDKDIIVAANANATMTDLNGAGLQIGNRSAGGNITFFYDSVSNVMSLSHGANIANVLNVAGNIAATGNLTAGNFLGSGSNTTIAADNQSWVFDSTGNLTAPGNITASGNITATGNTTSGNVNLTGNIVDTGALSIITGAVGNITLAPNGTSVLVATTTGVNIAGYLNTTGNISAGNVIGSGTNVEVAAGSYNWIFDNTGNLTLAGNTFAVNYANGQQVALGGSYSNSNVAAYLASNAAVTILTTANITTAANIAGNYILGNGAFLTGLPEAYGNANVANYLPTYTGNVGAGNLNLTGNIVDTGALTIITGSAGNITLAPNNTSVLTVTTTGVNVSGTFNATGNISAGNLIGSGNNVEITAGSYNWLFDNTGNFTLAGNSFSLNYANGSQVSLSGTYSNTNVAAYLPTYTGAINSLTGNVITTANVSGNFLLGNIRSATGGYNDANVAAYTGALTNLTGNVTTTANVSGAYLLGNGYFVSGIQYSNITGAYGNANVKTYLESGATINANFGGGNINTTGFANLGITQVNGNLVVTGNISATGNITYINVSDLVVSDPLIFLAANNPGDVQDIGLVANYNPGSGNLHTGFARDYTDSTWKVFDAVTSDPNTVVDWSQAVYAPFKAGSILSNATITANANVTAVGNVSGTYLLGNGYFISGIQYSNISGAYSNSQVAAYLQVYNGNASFGNISVSANVTAGNMSVANGNITVGNLVGAGTNVEIVSGAYTWTFDGAGNLTGNGNISAGNFVGTSGNTSIVTGPYTWVFNDGGNLVLPGNGFSVNYANGQQVTLSGTYSNSNVASYLASNAAVTVLTTGNITTTANIAGNYFIGNGALLTGVVTSSYSNANVANYLPTYTGNVSAGNLNLTGNIVDTGAIFVITGANGNVVLAPDGISRVIATTSGANVIGNLDVAGNVNANGATLTGNITAGNLSVANGNITLGNLVGSGTNVEIVSGDYTWTFDGAGNLTGNGNISAGNFVGSAGNTSIVTGAYAWVFNDGGNLVLPGNGFSVNYANGAQVSLSGTYSNSNVASYLASNAAVTILTTGNITTAANIAGNYILGNGSLLSGIITSVSNINNGNSNVSIVNSGGNVDFAVSGVSNVATVSQEGGFGAIFVNGVFSNPRNLSSGNLPDNVNSMLVGPITVGNGVIVGMPDDARLVIM